MSPELILHRCKSTVALSSLCPFHSMGWDLEEWRGRTPFPRSQILEIQPEAHNSVGFSVGSRCSGVSSNHCCWPLPAWDLLQTRQLPSQWKSLAKNEFQQKNHKSKSQSSSKTSQIIFIKATKCLTHFKIFLESTPMTKPYPLSPARMQNQSPSIPRGMTAIVPVRSSCLLVKWNINKTWPTS